MYTVNVIICYMLSVIIVADVIDEYDEFAATR